MAQARDPDAGAALSLYGGKVMHARLKPVGHRFSYKVASILIDLDRLEYLIPDGYHRGALKIAGLRFVK